jgi:hypothetical protein
VERLIRAVPAALRRRERPRRRETGPRRTPSRKGVAVALLAGLILGVALAAATKAWHEARDGWNARLERLLAALEAPQPSPSERQLDRWQRLEELQARRAQQGGQRERLEQDRLQELFRRLPLPQYPTY